MQGEDADEAVNRSHPAPVRGADDRYLVYHDVALAMVARVDQRSAGGQGCDHRNRHQSELPPTQTRQHQKVERSDDNAEENQSREQAASLRIRSASTADQRL